MKSLLLSTFLALLILTVSDGAISDAQAQNASCATYAATAVTQNKQNKLNNCGFSGLRWHSDRGAHEAFCSLVGTGKSAKETKKRQRDLDGCLANANQQNEVNNAPQCKKSEIAVGKGNTTQSARAAAQDILGAQKAQMIHEDYSKCIYKGLGCSGPNGDRTCRLSVKCCTQ